MVRLIKIFTVWIPVFFVFVFPAHAAYVLPYPSYMPGNKLYRISRIVDSLNRYWHWGAITSLKFSLSLSDKYLVETKTLFEYNQYLLAIDALSRSNQEFIRVSSNLVRVKNQYGESQSLVIIINDASAAHIEVLSKLKKDLPIEFHWTPEKAPKTLLKIHKLLDNAIEIRRQSIQDELL